MSNYTSEEVEKLRARKCPDCGKEIGKAGDTYSCEDWENCGFFIKESRLIELIIEIQ